MTHRIAVLAGDGIGPEVVEGALVVLRAVASDLNIGIVYALEGGYSLEAQAESIVESLIASTAEKFDPAELPMPYRPSQSAQAGFESLRRALHGIWDI